MRLALFLASLLVVQSAHAQASDAPATSVAASDALTAATNQLSRGEYEQAEKTVRRYLLDPSAERDEAHRLLGLALFFQERTLEARAEFLEYLLLEPDAHLDPALVPPEAIAVFEDVRARNLAAIESRRPKPPKKRYALLNLVPAAGQLQNGETTKAIAIGAGLSVAIAANIASYYWLTSNCDPQTRVCGSPEDDSGRADDIQAVNQLAGVAAISIYAYSVIDGYLGHRRALRRERSPKRAASSYMRSTVLPMAGGRGVQLRWDF